MDPHNMSWVRYPSQVSPDVEAVITAQTVISRCTQVYISICVPLGLATGLFNLGVFMRERARLGAVDALFAGLTVTSILRTLLSLNAAGRPDYVLTTNLGCGVLSFLSNVCYFTAQYLQGATLVPTLLPGCLGHLRLVPGLAAIMGCAVCSALIVVSLLGTSGELHRATMCQVDPLTAWPEYEIVKFSLGLALALSFQLVLLVLCATRPCWRAAVVQRDPATGRWAVLAVALNMLACRLFYSVALLRRAGLKLRRDLGSPNDELLMNMAELVLSAEGCVTTTTILFLHPPCRLALCSLLGRLTQKCRRDMDNNMSLDNMEG